MHSFRVFASSLALALSACGGGGGGSSSPAPTGSISLDKSSVSVSASTTDAAAPTGTVNVSISITGSGTPTVLVTSTTSGIASVSKVLDSNSHATVTIQFKAPTALAAATYNDTVTIKTCFDAGCTQPLTGSPATVTTQFVVTASATVAVSGKVTFDKVPGNATGIGLDYPGIINSPARGVLVEAVQVSNRTTVAASTSTDAGGNFTLNVPSNTNLFLRAKAEMLRTGTPGWHFRVLDNTASNALWAINGADFSSGAVNSTRNLNASSGWNGSSYASTRAAAPFAILDTVYKAYTLVLGVNAAAVFPDLELYWSKNNKPSASFTAATGDIETTQFNPAIPANQTKAAIYILGDENVDTDEYDDSVIAHEWGHYFQDSFSRDDSFGGAHALSDQLDLRVAFSEGWGDAFSGMASGKTLYQDAQGPGQANGSCSGLESNSPVACGAPANLGWYNELSVARVLFDVFDSASDGVDTVNLGFGPIFTVMNNEMKTTRALTSIYVFGAALKSRNPSDSAGIDALLHAQDIATVSPNFDAYGSGETNNAGDPTVVPVYAALSAPGSLSNVCSNTNFGTDNKLGVSKYLKFTLSAARSVTFTATGASGADPDLVVYGPGFLVSGEKTGTTETLTTSLGAGDYVLEIYEYSNTTTTPLGNTCFTVAIN